MSAKIKLNATTGGGSVSIQAPSSSSNNRVITLPDIADGDLLTSQSSLSSAKLTGALPAIDGSALTGLGGGLPTGAIILWSGAENAIPTGYVLCDGNNSTPDLRDRFVVGAGNSYSVAATGGATTDTVSVSISGTTGNNANGTGRATYMSCANNHLWSHSHSFSGSGSDTVNTLPPYYALCYIMKS